MKASKSRVVATAVMAMFFWGMSFIWSKVVFRYYSPLGTIFIRLVLSSVILLLLWYLFYRKDSIRRKDVPLFLLAAFFTPFLYFTGESYGLNLVSSTVAAVIIATIPVFTPIVAWALLKERLGWLSITGLVVSFAGVLVMILKKDFSLNASSAGILLLGLAVVAAVGNGIAVKKLALQYQPITIVTFQNLLGALYFLPFFLAFDLEKVQQVRPDRELITNMLALVIFASSLAFILYTYTVKHIGVARANIYSNLIPVFTAVFSVIILGEVITAGKLAGMVMVITGVLLAQLGRLLPGRNGKYSTESNIMQR